MAHAGELIDDTLQLLPSLLHVGVTRLSAEPLPDFRTCAVGHQIAFFGVLPIQTGPAGSSGFAYLDYIAGLQRGV